jgi:hypothetical protein
MVDPQLADAVYRNIVLGAFGPKQNKMRSFSAAIQKLEYTFEGILRGEDVAPGPSRRRLD